jgi:hypothetical protein
LGGLCKKTLVENTGEKIFGFLFFSLAILLMGHLNKAAGHEKVTIGPK